MSLILADPMPAGVIFHGPIINEGREKEREERIRTFEQEIKELAMAGFTGHVEPYRIDLDNLESFYKNNAVHFSKKGKENLESLIARNKNGPKESQFKKCITEIATATAAFALAFFIGICIGVHVK